MKRILKLPINQAVSNQLAVKQQNIDTGTVQPDFKLSFNQRTEIKVKLLKSQKYLCCYCECEIDDSNYHIEHFYEQHDKPEMTYNYLNNLILSCEGDRERRTNPESDSERAERLENISCGHKKTKSYHADIEIDYSLLLNPMNINSNLLTYLNGIVDKSIICNRQEENQVIYSKQRLRIDSIRLNNLRISKIDLINRELKKLDLQEQKKFIKDLLDENQEKLPAFYSTIKNNFEFIVNE